MTGTDRRYEPHQDAPAVQFGILGSLEVHRDGTPVAIGSRRLRTLLAALLIDAGKVVSVDALAEAVWGERPPAEPRNAIQTYVARLRERLGPDAPLVTRSPGYVLDVEPDQVDASRFEELLAEAHNLKQDAPRARMLLDEALGLWRGPAYAEFSDGLARAEALRLDERRLVTLEERAAARLALGEADLLVAELEALTAEHPLRERFVELLMRALAATDRQADALSAFRDYRDRLADETGLEPSSSLRELESLVLREEVVEAPATPTSSTAPDPTVRAGVAVSAGPPTMATSLIGREEEIRTVLGVLERHRVVTLTGAGGVGKTRIAAQVTTAFHRDGSCEVAWIDLSTVADPEAVEHVIATSLGVDLGGGSPRAALLAALADRSLLLVLDNCEHLLETVAPLVDDVQRRCPPVRVLATSRERLAIDGEQVLPVSPLRVGAEPDGVAGEAVRLFCERAAANGVDLDGRLEIVAEICRELDGLPLAIELAAARSGALPLEALLGALREDEPAAVGQRRSTPERHRDLWAVVDWSYRLLTAEEQQLFERLSVFAGAFDPDEAHAVCAPPGQKPASTARQLAALSERSLLSSPMTGSAAGRYRVLRTLRAFARQRLADRRETDAVADRHTSVFIELLERAVDPPMSDEGIRWIETSLDDLRQIRSRALQHRDVDTLARLVAALYPFDYWRAGAELIGWADEVLAIEGIDEHPAAPQVHAAAAAAAWMRGEFERAERLAVRGTTLGAGANDPARTNAFEALGDVATFQGRLDDAEAAFRERIRLAQLGDDPDAEVLGLASLALILAYAGRMSEAIREADAAGRTAARAGPSAHAFARYVQGECRTDTAPEEAIALAEEAAELARDCNAWFTEGVARLTAASLRGRHRDPREALPAYADLLNRWRRSGNWTQQWTTLRNVVELLVRLEADEPAVVIAAAAEVEESAAPTFGPESDRLADAVATARARLGEARFEVARAEGRRLPRQAVVDLALTTLEARSE